MKRKDFEAEMKTVAIDRMKSNMEWGLTRIRELHADPEKVIDQVYGFNMGIFALMPEEFFNSYLEEFTEEWDVWLTEARKVAV